MEVRRKDIGKKKRVSQRQDNREKLGVKVAKIYICVCVHVCMYMHIYVCRYLYDYKYMCIYVYIHVCIGIHAYMCVCIFMYICIFKK